MEWGLTSIVCKTLNSKDLALFTSFNFTKLRGDIILVVHVVTLSGELFALEHITGCHLVV